MRPICERVVAPVQRLDDDQLVPPPAAVLPVDFVYPKRPPEEELPVHETEEKEYFVWFEQAYFEVWAGCMEEVERERCVRNAKVTSGHQWACRKGVWVEELIQPDVGKANPNREVQEDYLGRYPRRQQADRRGPTWTRKSSTRR